MLKKIKRRKDKYNPYILYLSDDNRKYYVEFNNCKIKVEENIFQELNKFELEDKSQMNKYDRYIEHSKITEYTLNKRAINQEETVEDIVISKIEKEVVHKAIMKLPEVQRRRVYMYFFKQLKQKEIANIDGVSIRAIQYSLEIGLKNIKKLLEKASY